MPVPLAKCAKSRVRSRNGTPTDHTLTPRSPKLAIRVPSGENTIPRPPPPGRIVSKSPVRASHIQVVLSRLAPARRRPFGENATSKKGALCPANVSNSSPVRASHMCTARSWLPYVTTRLPSGENLAPTRPPTVSRRASSEPVSAFHTWTRGPRNCPSTVSSSEPSGDSSR